ncbi:hypothetical protein [Paraflavitalea sp. CAU 1676]|uniref:hypothetical protein n=1 Tax=Paraflavitalea sp. CAU 1676 TaxID=3032598 RepID=UPI0023D9FEC6|nr:hypothetical protein [Paraflavitalea sp. CAU 1676]MDF2189522.1 hypothetical protein [Paraflavitalea sp. CAU 1676]
MKNMRYITICAGILLILACGKDKPETKPSIKLKYLSTKEIQPNQPLEITLEFSDKEGDVDDSLYVKRDRLNKIDGDFGNKRTSDSFYIMIPKFPSKMTGEILLNLAYNGYLVDAESPHGDASQPNGKVPDSIRFRFALQDRGGNTSDTLTTEQIVIIRQ